MEENYKQKIMMGTALAITIAEIVPVGNAGPPDARREVLLVCPFVVLLLVVLRSVLGQATVLPYSGSRFLRH
jgi:hypothetical protein